MPARTFGAPHTTCSGAPPALTRAHSQPVGIRMLFDVDDLRDNHLVESGAAGSMASTSMPAIVNASAELHRC